MKKERKTKRFSICITPSYHQALVRIAKIRGVTVAEIVRWAIRQFLE